MDDQKSHNGFEILLQTLTKFEEELAAEAQTKKANSVQNTLAKAEELIKKRVSAKTAPLKKSEEMKKCGYCGESMAKCGCDKVEKYAKGELDGTNPASPMMMSKNALNPAKPVQTMAERVASKMTPGTNLSAPKPAAAPMLGGSLSGTPGVKIPGPSLGKPMATPSAAPTGAEKAAAKMPSAPAAPAAKPKLPGIR